MSAAIGTTMEVHYHGLARQPCLHRSPHTCVGTCGCQSHRIYDVGAVFAPSMSLGMDIIIRRLKKMRIGQVMLIPLFSGLCQFYLPDRDDDRTLYYIDAVYQRPWCCLGTDATATSAKPFSARPSPRKRCGATLSSSRCRDGGMG
jgi:hypothetical protein